MPVSSRIRSTFVAALCVGCNEGLRPTPPCGPGFVGVCGTVTFVGALPDSTASVYIVAFPTFPQSPADLFSFQPFPPTTELLLDSASRANPQPYSVGLPNGRYEWVLAAWVKQGFTPSNADSTLREAGFYRDHGDTTTYGTGIVHVNNAGTGLVDFVVDFNKMHPVSYYFPSPPP